MRLFAAKFKSSHRREIVNSSLLSDVVNKATVKLFVVLNPSRRAPSVSAGSDFEGLCEYILKGLILAQNERWRRGLGMQVERIPGGHTGGGSGERGSKAWVTYPGDGDSHS